MSEANQTAEQLRLAIREALDETDGLTLDSMADAIMEVIVGETGRRLEELLIAESRFRAMEVRDGKVVLEAVPAREIVGMWAGAARSLLDGAENYAEIEMEFRIGETGERYAFTLQKVGKLTPHQARQAAEAELLSLRAELAELRNREEILATDRMRGAEE